MPHRTIFAAAATFAAAALAPIPAAAEVLGGFERDVPLARFADPICPGVIGMKTEVAEAIIGRIRENATNFGLTLADPTSCEPNLIVTFLVDGKDYITQLEKRRGWMFIDMTMAERKALFDTPGKVRTWSRTVVRTRDGMPVGRRLGLVHIPLTSMAMAHSKIYVATQRNYLAAMVLIDRDSIEGLSVFQLGDYVTMRALGGEALLTIAPPEATILSLFDKPGSGVKSLTAADQAFLEVLYSSLPNLPASLTLATVGKRIEALEE